MGLEQHRTVHCREPPAQAQQAQHCILDLTTCFCRQRTTRTLLSKEAMLPMSMASRHPLQDQSTSVPDFSERTEYLLFHWLVGLRPRRCWCSLCDPPSRESDLRSTCAASRAACRSSAQLQHPRAPALWSWKPCSALGRRPAATLKVDRSERLLRLSRAHQERLLPKSRLEAQKRGRTDSTSSIQFRGAPGACRPPVSLAWWTAMRRRLSQRSSHPQEPTGTPKQLGPIAQATPPGASRALMSVAQPWESIARRHSTDMNQRMTSTQRAQFTRPCGTTARHRQSDSARCLV